MQYSYTNGMGTSWTVIQRQDTSGAGDDVFDMTPHLLQWRWGGSPNFKTKSGVIEIYARIALF